MPFQKNNLHLNSKTQKPKIMAQKKSIFKYENLETGFPVYFGKVGNDYHKAAGKAPLKFVCMLSPEELEEEEKETLLQAERRKETQEEEEFELEKSRSKSKGNVTELSKDDLKNVDKKKVKIKKDDDDLIPDSTMNLS